MNEQCKHVDGLQNALSALASAAARSEKDAV